MPQNSVHAIPITYLNANTFAGVWVPINPLGLPQPCFCIRIVNDSNVSIDIRYNQPGDDIWNSHVRPNSDADLMFQTNAQPTNYVALMAKGTVVSVNAIAGVGLVYLVGYYVNQS